jgi:cation diffusion facilitator CzcD-associated flavoprotein CzcO
MLRSRPKPTVAIIGAAAGGIAMGIRLKRAGYEFTIYEKSDGVGGTWRDNDYPGAACDVPSHLYSFSFELNPWWSRTYATQPEILAYLERCTDQYGIRPHVRTGVAITTATWNDRAHWGARPHRRDLHRGRGGERTRHAEFPSSRYPRCGPVPRPLVPFVAGTTASPWPVSGSLIGTGASAIQYVPAIAPEVEHVTVFQRSPIWITPRLDQAFTAEEQRRFARVPGAARRHRWKIWWTYERANFQTTSELTEMQTALARSYLERKIADPALRAKLTPDYPVG